MTNTILKTELHECLYMVDNLILSTFIEFLKSKNVQNHKNIL